MLVTRWLAPRTPDIDHLTQILKAEGLEPIVEEFKPQSQVTDHRHPFDEVRVVVAGQMLFDIAGNRILLRSGDRILIPTNTRHSMKNDGPGPCLTIYAPKPF